MPHLWMSANNHHLDIPRCTARNHWRSFNTHFQNGAMTVSLSLLPIKAAVTFIMPNHYQITYILPYLKDQKSLMLRWHSFPWWGKEDVTHCFAWSGHQNIVSELVPQISTLITHDAKPKVVDARLTLIFRIGQWPCRFPFCLYRQSSHSLCLTTTTSLSNCLP